LNPTFPAACRARIGDDRALAVTAGAGLAQLEDPLPLRVFAAAIALRAGCSLAGLGAFAAAVAARLEAAQRDVPPDFVEDFVKLKVEHLAAVGASAGPGAATSPSTTSTHERADNVAEEVAEVRSGRPKA
jgi:hypothetical protein